MYPSIDLSTFPPEREQKLRSIYRYSLFETMLYRSNLWQHSHRVLWIVEKLLPLAGQYFPALDHEKTRILALVHDDAEMLTGDIQAGTKARMTEDELKKIEEDEVAAVKSMVKSYPDTIHGYSYKELLLHVARKDCIEALIVMYADKLDAYCESLHELLAGNITILRSIMLYDETFALMHKKFPELAEFLRDRTSPFTYLRNVLSPEKVKRARYALFGIPHTEASIRTETDFPFYNEWRILVLNRAGVEGMQWLTQIK
jgi:hypothetical protein